MKKIIITGASGFVGTNLTKMLQENGYEVESIKRDDLKDIKKLISKVDGCHGIINLAGANIINRWSDEYKNLLYSSRIDTTKAIVEAIELSSDKPKFLISTSAVGIYDNKAIHDEYSSNFSNDFLSKLCQDWESEAMIASKLGVRVCIARFGIVLGDGGALAKMLTPFKLGLGGTIGDGLQGFSFIHINDLVNGYKFLIDNENLDGVFNMCAPTPTTNYGLTKALGKYLHRPTLIPVPEFILKLIFSEGAKVLTDGQQAVPKRLLESGFEFKFENIEETIKDLV